VHYLPDSLPGYVLRLPSAVFSLLFPDDCRLCGEPLREISRVSVCSRCLNLPEPLSADYFCASCRTPFLNASPLDENGLCALCRNGLRGFDAAYSYGGYEGALRELIHLFKYNGVYSLAKPLGKHLAAALPRDERFDAVVPMPLHWLRRWRRGFNQSELLAREIGRRLGVPVVCAVRRKRSTESQAGLSNAKRRVNVAGAFEPKRGRPLEGKRVLLIDDVMTTGATAAACAAAAKLAGARYVALLALARTDRRSSAPSADTSIRKGSLPKEMV